MTDLVDKVAPFPVKPFKTKHGNTVPRSFIPTWMVDIVYDRMKLFHPVLPPVEFYLENGLDAGHVLDLLCGGDGSGDALAQMLKTKFKMRNVTGEIAVIRPGTKEYTDTVKEFESQVKQETQEANSRPMFFHGR